jgi:hypothetical protein
MAALAAIRFQFFRLKPVHAFHASIEERQSLFDGQPATGTRLPTA